MSLSSCTARERLMLPRPSSAICGGFSYRLGNAALRLRDDVAQCPCSRRCYCRGRDLPGKHRAQVSPAFNMTAPALRSMGLIMNITMNAAQRSKPITA
ncbi:hypothetical protein SAMN04487926_11862 [Paraburkholderia steynii]|uniref:Uncharacterized protein n=1 Tax=Paraburkholderia steynii TaxID=1245441 RepID=A0A7Z7FLA7_9BURK|nr:hypothetical protein SAMN04487926_11862 [Paraburkholderia steynii]